MHFECNSLTDEPEKRFHHFTTQLLPSILKSAVQSTNTIIFISSSFDFIRIKNYLRKHGGVTFTVLSEYICPLVPLFLSTTIFSRYSSNPDISRARLSFFESTASFLLVSERFHFFRRYKIRGCRNLIFYEPPDHAQYYTEFLSYPFLDDGVEGGDVTCQVLFSKYDRFKLERIVGSEGLGELIKTL